jgi:hypothetical protein
MRQIVCLRTAVRLSKAAPLLFAIFFVTTTVQAHACSVCIAHALGAALHGLGAQTLAHRSWVVGVNYTTFQKSNAGDDPGTFENEEFHQVSLEALYGLTDWFNLRVSVPFIDKTVKLTGMPDENASGLGDIVLGGIYQLKPRVKDRFLTAFTLDLKLPTGNNGRRDSIGDLKEQHLQVGSGSTDVIAGIQLTREGVHPGSLWLANLRGRVNGTNGRGFHYGDVIFYDVGYVHPVGINGAAVVEFNGRIADKDKNEDGSIDGNSGGHLGYVSLSFRQGFKQGLGVIASMQVPVWKQLNGTQEEKALYSVTLSKLF